MTILTVEEIMSEIDEFLNNCDYSLTINEAEVRINSIEKDSEEYKRAVENRNLNEIRVDTLRLLKAKLEYAEEVKLYKMEKEQEN